MITMGCAHERRKTEIEIWLIDPQDLVLFRELKDEKEQIIPIQDNPDMDKFIVIDKRFYLEYIFDEIEGR